MGLSSRVKKKTWKLIEEELRGHIEGSKNVLVESVKILNVKDSKMIICVRDNYMKDTVEKNFLKDIKKLVNSYDNFKDVKFIEVIVDDSAFSEVNFSEGNENIKIYDDREEFNDIYVLNEKYKFESFVVGSSNELAHAAALSAAKVPGEKANPLFIYGGSGLGKTHLMQAIGHYILEKNPNKKIAYVSSEKFTNDFIEALKSNTPHKFREKYRKVDVLLVDDIQFLAGKEETQKEFFHTFNALYDEKKQIVLTSDKSPAKLDGLEERLVSRFKSGLIADIQKPDIELRIAILEKEAKKLEVDISKDLIAYIAQKVVSNIRDLEGAFKNVIIYKSLTGKELNEDVIDNILKDFVIDDKKEITIGDIQQEVAKYYDVTVEDILSSKRDKKIVLPRQMAMYIARDLTGKSSTAISRSFGKKDHTTVLHACKKIEEKIKNDEQVRRDFQKIRGKLLDK